jgi:hypothetical protein
MFDCLCEETRKDWQNAFSDEIIYLDQSAEALIDTGLVPTKTYGELHGVVKIKFMLKGGGDAYYIACIRNLNCEDSFPVFRSEVGKMQDGSTPISRNPPMLVEVTYLVKPPQRVSLVCSPSVIRLKRCNLTNRFSGHTDETPIERVQSTSGQDWTIDDWESRPFWDTAEPCQSPNQLVQRSSHVVDGIACNQTDGIGNVQQIKAEDIPLIFRIILARKGIGIRFTKLFNLMVEKMEMSLCPSKFRLCIMNSTHERNLTEDAFD